MIHLLLTRCSSLLCGQTQRAHHGRGAHYTNAALLKGSAGQLVKEE